jgi:hypothetical protein
MEERPLIWGDFAVDQEADKDSYACSSHAGWPVKGSTAPSKKKNVGQTVTPDELYSRRS